MEISKRLAIIDVMSVGPPLNPSNTLLKGKLDEFRSWERFNPDACLTDEQVCDWFRTTRHEVMYKNKSQKD